MGAALSASRLLLTLFRPQSHDYESIHRFYSGFERIAQKELCNPKLPLQPEDETLLKDAKITTFQNTEKAYLLPSGLRLHLKTSIIRDELRGYTVSLEFPAQVSSPLHPSLLDSDLKNRPLIEWIILPDCKESIQIYRIWNSLGLVDEYFLHVDQKEITHYYLNRPILSLDEIYSKSSVSEKSTHLAEAARKDRTLVTVLDSGIDYNHPDLADRIQRTPFLGKDYQDGDALPYDYPDRMFEEYSDFHGTHVAGIIAKDAPEIALLPLRISYWNDLLQKDAIDYAANVGSRILNLSMGSGTNHYQAFEQGVIAHPEMLFVIAAGNSGKNNDLEPVYPATFDHENILTVAAVNELGELARISNYGKKSVKVAAPGIDIVSTIQEGKTAKALFGE